MRKVSLIFALLVALAIVSGKLWIALMGRDCAAPDVSDLTPVRPDIRPEENAYTFFVAATNTLCWPSNTSCVTDYLDGKPVDDDVLVELISRNEATIDQIRQGVGCRICLAPEVTGFDSLLPYLASWRNMARALAIKIRHDRLNGAYTEAMDGCILLLKFGDLVHRDAECLIHYLVGVAIMEIGFTEARALASDRGAPPEDLRRLSAALSELGSFAPGLVRGIEGEYRSVANTVDRIRKGEFLDPGVEGSSLVTLRRLLRAGSVSGYVFQPNRTKLLFANLYRGMIENVPRYYADMQHHDVERELGLKQGRVPLFMRPNALAKILCGLLVPAVDPLLERKCRAECNMAGTRLVVAIQLFRREKGALPADLVVLEPRYLSAVPADPFDGKAFRYLPTKGIVYSVGKDLVDAGGSTLVMSQDTGDNVHQQRWQAEDAVFGIEAIY